VDARDAALAVGAKDFITKPFESTEVLLRVHNLLETRLLHLELRRQRNLLAERFESRGRELEQARFEILERLARVAEHRDDGAFGHIRRVGDLSALIAAEMECSPELVEQIRRAATLHDVGKIAIPDGILLKPGRLTPGEFEIQERHTLIGADILSGGGFPVLRLAEQIALTHHERWDGKGYPNKLVADAIPLAGRIVAVADNFDALMNPRPYKVAWPPEDVLAYIEQGSGQSFDPAVVQAFVRAVSSGEVAVVMESWGPLVGTPRLSA
jgi:putative two-component system response regulator